MGMDEMLARLDAEQKAQRERARAVIAESGRADVLAEFDANMKLLDLGITTARAAWAAIGTAQQRILRTLAEGGVLIRSTRSGQVYDVVRGGARVHLSPSPVAASLRPLARRNLLAWDGGATDPEAKAVITEAGRFVLRHGGGAQPGVGQG